MGDLGSIPGWEDPLEKEMATQDGGNNGTFMRTVVKIDRLVMVTNLLSLPIHGSQHCPGERACVTQRS